jgi:uncharacterized protein (TIGR00730 family)
LRSIRVFCGSRPGNDHAYEAGARRLGRTLVERGTTLVYGGGRVGIMGVVAGADAVLDAGGEAIGVIPKALVDREITHTVLTDLRVVGSMHERKALMSELSEGFVALPSDGNTLEEFFEVQTWAQLGEHEKPCGLLNVGGYYDPLLALCDHMVAKGFLSEEHRAMVLVESEPEPLLDAFAPYQLPQTPKWIGKAET